MAFGVFNKAFEFNESALRTTKGKMRTVSIDFIDALRILFLSDVENVKINVDSVPLPLWLWFVSEDIAMIILPGLQILCMICWLAVSVGHLEELWEWAVQARRWTLGAAEVFHYFVVKSPEIPGLTALAWGCSFLFYYGILLCCSHLYGPTLGLSSAFILAEDATVFGTSLPMFYLAVHVSLGVLFLNSMSMFALDKMTQRLLIPKPEERISSIRQVFISA